MLPLLVRLKALDVPDSMHEAPGGSRPTMAFDPGNGLSQILHLYFRLPTLKMSISYTTYWVQGTRSLE